MNTPSHHNGNVHEDRESLSDIVTRVGEKYFSPPETLHNGTVEATPPKTTQVVPVVSESALPAVPDYIRSEQFLEVSGFFTPSSRRIEKIYVKEKKIREYIDEEGKRKILRSEITANHELGLPSTSDLDYYRAFLKLCD